MTEQHADIQQLPADIPNMTANDGEDAPEQGRQGKGKAKAKAKEPVAGLLPARFLAKRQWRASLIEPAFSPPPFLKGKSGDASQQRVSVKPEQSLAKEMAKLPVRPKPLTLKGATTEHPSPSDAAAVNDGAQDDSMDINASVPSSSLDKQATPNSDAISQAILPLQPSASSAHDDTKVINAVAASTNASAQQGGQSVTQLVQPDSGAQNNLRSAIAGFSNSSVHPEQRQQSVAPPVQPNPLGEPRPTFSRPPANGDHPIFVFRPNIDDMLEWATFVPRDIVELQSVFTRLENRGHPDQPGATQDEIAAIELARTQYATNTVTGGYGDVQFLERTFFPIALDGLSLLQVYKTRPKAHYVIHSEDWETDLHRIEIFQKLTVAFYAYLKAMHMIR